MNIFLKCALLLALTGAASSIAQAKKSSLYEQLGAKPGVERAVDAILVEVKADKRIKDLFAETDFPYLRERLIEQICVIAGGPCEYQGLSMEDAHSGMAISSREFNWFVEDVEIGLANARIGIRAQNALLARFAKMRGEVMGK